MADVHLTNDRRPTDANAYALAATVELRKEREKVNADIEALQARAKHLSIQICAIERKAYNDYINLTPRN